MPKQKKVAPPKRVNWKLFEPEDALQLMLRTAKTVTEAEEVELSFCLNRVLAKTVKSTHTWPPVDRSERDGYAIKSADCTAARLPQTLQQVGEATAGRPFLGTLKTGQSVRIATGAVIPAGADAVVMFEDVNAGDGGIALGTPVPRHCWVSRTGSDLKRGDTALRKGTVLRPQHIACASVLGLAALPVLRKPTTVVFTTGNEVRKPGERLGPGDVYDGNTAALVALLREQGIDARARATVRDTLAAQRRVLREAATRFDLIVFTGGTSVGDKDYGRRALDAEGRTLIHGVKVKPGKPLLFGRIGKCVVCGLPGFPTSSLMVAYRFLAPLARKLAGFGDFEISTPFEATLAAPLQPDRGRIFLAPVRESNGALESTFKGSASITTVSEATAYVELPPGGKKLARGAKVIAQRL